MTILTRIKPSAYHDSVTLMLVAKAILELPGVQDAAVVMGTPANREIIGSAGLLTPRPRDPAGRSADRRQGRGRAGRRGCPGQGRRDPGGEGDPHGGRAYAPVEVIGSRHRRAAGSQSGRDLRCRALCRPGGAHRAGTRPARPPLLRQRAAGRRNRALATGGRPGPLCMGPDAGTAIINGVALGFANAVPRGSVGLVRAAGTGLGVTCGLARAGAGVSQAIGTGGRDLSEAVGGQTMLAGLQALQEDPGTSVIVLISKPPAAAVAERAWPRPNDPKPIVVCSLGADPGMVEKAGAIPATNLTQAAANAAALATGANWCDALVGLETDSKRLIPLAVAERARLFGRPRTVCAPRPVRRRHVLLRGPVDPEEPARAGAQQRAADKGQ